MSKEKKQKKNKKKNDLLHIPKTVQDSIPYIAVYKNGVIEVKERVFSKTYKFEDTNFKLAADEEQDKIFLAYGDLLNSFNSDVKVQITINNKNIDKEEFFKNILLKLNGDGLDEYRQEYNDMLKEKASEGNNNIIREKYITLSIEEDDIEMANAKFRTLEGELNNSIKRITGKETQPMSLKERLDVLYNIYNLGEEQYSILKSMTTRTGQEVKAFDVVEMAKMGLTTKDVIGPNSMKFQRDYFEMGEVYGQVLYLQNVPTYLSTDFLSDITSLPYNMLTSIHTTSLPQDEALQIMKRRMTSINANVIEAQKRASKDGYSPDILPPDLLKAKNQIEKVYEDATTRNQKLFMVTLIVTHFASTKEELFKNAKTIQMAASKRLCQLKILHYQQEAGLTTSLPLAFNKVTVNRTLTTESTCVFIPFEAEELSQPNGMYYGLNGMTKNMILYNRINAKNGNGVILGTPGTGKSFSAKREMLNILLNTNDEVYVIDPEGEYARFVKMMGGQEVRMAAGSNVFINPMDMDMNYADKDDPVTLKSDFVCTLCETLIGGRFGITSLQKSILDRCVRQLYDRYIQHMQELNDPSITCDVEASPTLTDLYELLMEQPEPEASNIALALELYTHGSYNIFSRKTNVELKNRFVVFNIRDLGTNMQEMGQKIVLNFVWNKMIENGLKEKRTWFYIDEFYIMTKTEASASFLKEIWKRARKWLGMPTGITQNVEDILSSETARTIISNSDFVYMLSQAPLDRRDLAHMFNLSETEVEYITEKGYGVGLLYNGKSAIPFEDRFPTDTKLFKAMATGSKKENRTDRLLERTKARPIDNKEEETEEEKFEREEKERKKKREEKLMAEENKEE